MTVSELFPIELIRTSDILPTEHHDQERARVLREEIEITGVWTHPLLVDRASLAIMDGNHRYSVAQALHLDYVPVILLSYDDPAVVLQSWRPGHVYSPEIVRQAGKTGKLLPIKSTRHIINARLGYCRVPLETLRSPERHGEPVPSAAPHPSRVQTLTPDYHAFGTRLGIRTLSADKLDLETSASIVPHPLLRRTLEADPAMNALLPSAPCAIAIGQNRDTPFSLRNGTLLVSPVLLTRPAALAAAVRWGMEAAFMLRSGKPTLRGLGALLRHGGALIGKLSVAEKHLILFDDVAQIGGEMLGTALSAPSTALLTWILSRVSRDLRLTDLEPGRPVSPTLELPVEDVLVSNGDSRLKVDPSSGKNRYGTTPRPRPEAVHFSSSTASSISDYGFLFCDVLRRDIVNHMLLDHTSARSVRARLSDAIIAELADLLRLDAGSIDGAIAPSGTDTELLAVLIARAAAPEMKLVNILISPEETGRGVKLAGAGRYFDEMSSTGARISQGAEVWPGADISTETIAIRDAAGASIQGAVVDAAFLAAGKKALDAGARVLAHVLIGSKTGLAAPSFAVVEQLRGLAPDRVDVVVDACQMRIEPAALGACLRRGWLVQVSGSKFMTGPPFSGALLFPSDLRARSARVKSLMTPGIGYNEDWSAYWAERLGPSGGEPDFGAPLRWLPALLETKLLRHVPAALRLHLSERFRREVTARMNQSACFRLIHLDEPAGDRLATNSIVSFEVLGTDWKSTPHALGEVACRRIFELLNQNCEHLLPHLSEAARSVLSQEFHIGQPVTLGQGPDSVTVLRLVLGLRFYTIVWHAGPGAIAAALESEISDLIRAIDKLEILASNWWKIPHG